MTASTTSTAFGASFRGSRLPRHHVPLPRQHRPRLYYTTVTVVVGFSMLTLSNFNPSIYFGVLTVLAMAAAVLGALLLLPRC
jgi:hypothetical protein